MALRTQYPTITHRRNKPQPDERTGAFRVFVPAALKLTLGGAARHLLHLAFLCATRVGASRFRGGLRARCTLDLLAFCLVGNALGIRHAFCVPFCMGLRLFQLGVFLDQLFQAELGKLYKNFRLGPIALALEYCSFTVLGMTHALSGAETSAAGEIRDLDLWP